MIFTIEGDFSKEAQSLKSRMIKAGYSDDCEPFSVRNLEPFLIYPKGPITSQSGIFALEHWFSKLGEPYASYLGTEYQHNLLRNSVRVLNVKECKEFLHEALHRGKIFGSGGYFSLSSSVDKEDFEADFWRYYGGPFVAYYTSNFTKVRHCWNATLWILCQKRMVMCQWFQYD